MLIKNTIIIFLFFTFLIKSKAQTDTSFWFVAPDISQGLGDRPIYLYFNTYAQAATVKITQPANGGFTPITKVIPANSIDSVNLTAFISSIENSTANAVLNNGLYISSTQKISAIYSIRSTTNKEYFSLKGTKALGVDFYVPMQEFWNQSPATSPKSFSSIDIVASLNNTTILITPKTNIIGHLANVSYTVLLQKGQTYSCQDTARSATTSLAGSIISSDKPVAISIQSSGLNQNGCLCSVGDQITSSAYIGTDYIVNKRKANTEKIFVLSTQNNTQITINDGTVTTVISNFGQNYIYTATQGITYVSANKPVYVLHVSGYGCRLSGAQLPPFFCAGTYTSSFTRTSSDSLALNLFTRTGFEGNFSLNGNASLIPASAFTVVPGSSGNIKSAKLYYPTSTIAVGSHNVVTNTGDVFGLGILNGSYNKGSAYAYVSEFVSYPTVSAGNSFTICANGNLLLNGQVGGGNINGTWSTNGYGTFGGGFTALSNTYTPSQIDTTVKPVKIFLTTNGPCPQLKDTLLLTVKPSPIVNASIDQIVCVNNSNVLLNGSVAGASTTGIWSSLGSGTFTPNNTTLNGTYLPSTADTLAGTVKLILTSTGTGICTLERDTMKITFTKPPFVNAGPASVTVCANNSTLALSGTVSGASNTGKWTSNGSGSFSPSNIQLNTGYIPSAADILAGQIKLYLTSTNVGNCLIVKDSILIVFTNSPSVNAGSDIYSCKNNILSVLSGTIAGATTTGIWSGGTGTFTPSNSVLNATYTPSAAEINTGVVNLVLTSTNNGNCNQVSDQVLIIFNSAPIVNAGVDLTSCKNNPSLSLSGVITGTVTTGIWTGGTGTFTPSNSTLNATYIPSTADLALGTVTLILTSTNNANCNSVSDTMKINYTNSPSVNAGVDIFSCKNNPATILSGTISGATSTGIWTGGTGSYNPSNSVLTTTYSPSASEISAGFVKLVLKSTNNGSCNQVNDTIKINFTTSPSVNAGSDIYLCKNNALANLSGTVSGGSTTGIWSGGTGTFTPNNSVLNPTYTPTQTELNTGVVNLLLTTTLNGNCNSVSDQVLIVFNNPPIVNAGIDLYSCINNPSVGLSGVISGTITTGIWSGGTGTYTPNNTSLSAIYLPSPADLSLGSVNLSLCSTNNANCKSVCDTVKINYTSSPTVNAGADIFSCKNKPLTALSGTITGATSTGVWTGGAGSYNPSNSVLTATYSPSASEISVGFVKLVLKSTNNGSCNQAMDTLIINFSPSPIVNAGVDLYLCKNNATAILSGTVSGGSTTGIWSGFTGTMSPSSSVLNPTYIPSAVELANGFANLTLTSSNNGNCNQVSDNVLIFFSNAPTVNAGVDLFSCKNNPTVVLSGVISGTVTTGIWSGGTGTFTPSNTSLNAVYNPSISELTSGSSSLYICTTNNGNCNAVCDTVKINYTNSPNVNAGSDIFICKNNPTIPLSGVVSGPTTTGIWTGGLGTYNPNNTSLTGTYTPTANEIATGFVKLILNSTNNGNCNQVTDTVKFSFTNSPVVNAGIDLNSCKNKSATVLAGVITGPTTTGIWSGGLGTYNPNNSVLNATYTPSASELSVGFANLTLTSSNNGNCNSVNDLVRITFVPKPFANFNFGNGCLNIATSFSDFSLPGIGSLTYWEWSFGDNTKSNLQNATHTFSTSGTFTSQLIVKNSYGCYDTIKKSPTIYPLPDVNFGITRLCSGNVLNLNFTDSTKIPLPESIIAWNWDFGGTGTSTIKNPPHLFPSLGLYNITLIATSNHNCKNTLIKKATLIPRPIAGFAYSISSGLNFEATVNFIDTSKYASYWNWNFGNNLPLSSLQNPSTLYYSNGVYNVTQIVSDAFGCSDTVEVPVNIKNIITDITSLIPNAISPNGDGKNDVWKLEFLNTTYPNMEVNIYNRWGENIYHSIGYSNPWDGTYKGEKLPIATYYYVLNLNDASFPEPIKGGILLIR